MAIENCSTCFKTSIPACTDEILIKLGLEADTPYLLRITDQVPSKTELEITSDGSGYLTIDTDDLPDGFLNPFTGSFTIEIFTAAGLTQAFTVDTVDYTCLQVEVYAGEGEAIIPSPNNAVASAPDPGETYLILD